MILVSCLRAWQTHMSAFLLVQCPLCQPFALVHCDVWTSPVLSTLGYKYYLVMPDDFSHFYWSFPLLKNSKSMVVLLISLHMLGLSLVLYLSAFRLTMTMRFLIKPCIPSCRVAISCFASLAPTLLRKIAKLNV